MRLQMLKEGSLNNEYIPITGLAPFVSNAIKLAYGEKLAAERFIGGSQSLSGTGALRLAAHWIGENWQGEKTILMPDPTWPNHLAIFPKTGLKIGKYQYLNYNPNTLDFEAMKHDLSTAPPASVVMLHACAHNPTGVDLTQEQWVELEEVIRA
eukprot:Platyproteum_vivax@DN7551_c0_g1_i1.p1